MADRRELQVAHTRTLLERFLGVFFDTIFEFYRITKLQAERYARVIRLKEEALNAARNDDAVDSVWFLDADAFVADPATLRHLLERGHPISAPLLTSTGPYSNFWAGMSPRLID